MHYKPEEIPILTPDHGNGSMRSIKAGEMEIGANWVKAPKRRSSQTRSTTRPAIISKSIRTRISRN